MGPGAFDDQRVRVIQAAFDLACEEIGLSEGDIDARERVSELILSFASAGQTDVERLKTYAVYHFKTSRMSHIESARPPGKRTGEGESHGA